MRALVHLGLGLLIGGVFLALALKGVPLDALGAALKSMDIRWLLPLAAVFMLQQVLRSWRQQILTRPLVPETKFRTHFSILCVSFFCINTFPARLGEAVRPWLLMEREELPLGSGFGVVFSERVLDLVFALSTLTLVLITADLDASSIQWNEQTRDLSELARWTGVGVLLPVIVAVLAVLFLGEPLLRLLESALLPRFQGRIGKGLRIVLSFIRAFSEGAGILRDPRRLSGLVALTLLTWFITGWMYVLLAFAFGIQDVLGWLEGMGTLVITMLGISLPTPPGQAGVYEAAARAALQLFGVQDGATALAYALVIHWWIFLVQSLSAFYFIARDGVELGSLFKRASSGSWGQLSSSSEGQ